MTSLADAPLTLVDRWGRVARKLRVSLTDQCNLRCTYCMPTDLQWLPGDDKLSDSEVVHLVGIGIEHLGISEVRYTGGEPLLRRGLETIVAQTAAMRTGSGEQPEISLTTNGLGLDKRAHALAAAGLHRINVSLDAGDPHTFLQITQRDRFAAVVAGIDAAIAAGLTPVKVNAVAMRSVNGHRLPDLLDFCLDRGLELRIIEHMPLGPSARASEELAMPITEILAALRTRRTLEPIGRDEPSAPATLWQVQPTPGHPGGRVGIIASMSAPFCGNCDRTRLTADGQVRTCLFSDRGLDLRELLRSDASDAQIAHAWAGAMWDKPRHHGTNALHPQRPDRYMNAIGG